MIVRDGPDHHGDVLDYLESEKLCYGYWLVFGIEDEWEAHTRETQ